jgi:hypothetical protein
MKYPRSPQHSLDGCSLYPLRTPVGVGGSFATACSCSKRMPPTAVLCLTVSNNHSDSCSQASTVRNLHQHTVTGYRGTDNLSSTLSLGIQPLKLKLFGCLGPSGVEPLSSNLQSVPQKTLVPCCADLIMIRVGYAKPNVAGPGASACNTTMGVRRKAGMRHFPTMTALSQRHKASQVVWALPSSRRSGPTGTPVAWPI